MKEHITPFDDSLPGRWYEVICDAGYDIPVGMYFRYDEEFHQLIGRRPETEEIIWLDPEMAWHECLDPLDEGAQPMSEEELFSGLDLPPADPASRHTVDPGIIFSEPVASRGELLYHLINRQFALDDQLILPEHAQGFNDPESGLFITPAYVRAHDQIIDAVAQDLIDHGVEGLQLASEMFSAHHLPFPGSEGRRGDPLPVIDEEREE